MNESVVTIGSLLKLDDYSVITFNTTSAALKGEKLMKEANRLFVIMPTPREISTSCGLSIKLKPEDGIPEANYLRGQGVDIAGIYRITRSGEERIVLPLEV